jgi:hypothetical protein
MTIIRRPFCGGVASTHFIPYVNSIADLSDIINPESPYLRGRV